MDKYQKATLVIGSIIVMFSISYAMLIIFGIIESYLPFYIIIPGFTVILIPIITRKRLEEQNRKEQSRNYLE
jgi:ABC-type multidrug transport system fused ATPase/permease subunit